MLEFLGIDGAGLVLLALALLLALSFEFVNGFHDTANAIATVIYTHSLRPTQAVLWSGLWNLVGVLTSSGAVAFGIVALLPVELVLDVGSGAGFAMVFALLLAALLWNLGTWSLGLPASSSHTLIGAIVGVGLMNAWLSHDAAFGDGVNWAKVADVGRSLLISPLLGFVVAGALLLAARAFIHNIALYAAPRGEDPPPWPVRALLVATCTGVSFAHGSNDGQKGMGLVMLILIGITPAAYALNAAAPSAVVQRIAASAVAIEQALTPAEAPLPDAEAAHHTLTLYLRGKALPAEVLPALARSNAEIAARLHGLSRIGEVPAEQRRALRIDLYLVSDVLAHLAKAGSLPATIDAAMAERYRADLKQVTTFIPVWVKLAVALALGLGTTVGWKRIVVTVGEKIGRAHLSYAQGAAAELATFATIEAADVLGLPVSTTHVLSSGVAGTMVANGSGLRGTTLRRLLLIWLLTLPVCVLLGATTFAAGLFVMFRMLGIR